MATYRNLNRALMMATTTSNKGVNRRTVAVVQPSSSSSSLVCRLMLAASQQQQPTSSSCGRRWLSTRPQRMDDEYDFDHDGNNDHDLLSLRESYALNSPQFKFPTTATKKKKKPLDAFMEALPSALETRKEKLVQNPNHAFDNEEEDDPILSLFRQMDLTRKEDWAPYAHFDPTKPYTRNLIYTDHVNYTLLLLCWNVGFESKIHDHPCDGCWLQVLQGQVRECRYEYIPHPPPIGGPEAANNDDEQQQQEDHSYDDSKTGNGGNYLKCIADETFHEGQLAFINDNIGLHKVGNPGTIPAVTLHLYHPPFSRCRVWDDEDNRSSAKSAGSTHFSEYGWVEGCSLP